MQRNEQIETQLAGHQVTKYVPSSWEEAVENNDEEDDYNDYNSNDSDDQENSKESNEESSEDEDPYADWFSSLSMTIFLSLESKSYKFQNWSFFHINLNCTLSQITLQPSAYIG